jgi:4-hydroxybenzoate polyprenyltransferase
MIRARRYRWLAVLPATGLLVGVPALNGVDRQVLGLPLLLFWIVGCVVMTSVVMAVIEALDRRHDLRAGREAPPPSEPGAR